MNTTNIKLYPVYLMGLVLMTATVWLLAPVAGAVHWAWGVLGALVLCPLAVLCHATAKKRTAPYITGYFMNAVGSGCAIAILYAQMAWDVSIHLLTVGLIPVAVLGLLLCLGQLMCGKLWHKIWGVMILLLSVSVLILSVVVWVKWNRVVGSYCFFGSICLLFFLMACMFALDRDAGKWRYLSFSGFWAFAVIAVVVVVILSEGDILDGLDFGDISFKKKKKVKK